MNKYLYIIIFFLLQSCTSNLYLANDKGANYSKVKLPKKLVRVTNPQHENYTILKKAGIYDITDKQSVSTELTLKESIVSSLNGSVGIFVTIFFGLLPVTVNQIEYFRYSISCNGTVEEKEYKLLMDERISVFEWLFKPFMFSRDRTRIKALKLASTRKD